MKAHSLRAVFAAAVLFATAAPAQELIENVVVRNRLHEASGRFELGVHVGFTLLSRLTDHYNFNLDVAYNLSESFALELQGGYALSRHTGLADQITDDVNSNSSLATVNDLSGLWEMQANGVLGLRWAPIYGKISLMAELPVHFQTYLWLGGGVGTFARTSVVDCDGGGCAFESKVGPLVSGAFGFRFFAFEHFGLKLEVRDYAYLDSYREGINAKGAVGETGTPVANPGIINLVMLNVGLQYLF